MSLSLVHDRNLRHLVLCHNGNWGTERKNATIDTIFWTVCGIKTTSSFFYHKLKKFPFNKLTLFVSFVVLTACVTEQQEKNHSLKEDTMNGKTATMVLDAKATLGEGAIWQHEENLLYWVDIEGKALHRYNPADIKNETFPVPYRIGTVVPAKESGVVVALQEGIYQMEIPEGTLTKMVNPEDSIQHIRFNDGKCDPAGRFWVGSMHLEQTPKAASLYRIDTDGSVHKVLSGITISNGIAWSSDAKKMYYIDTPTLKIMAYDYDLAAGTISNPKVAVEIPEEVGFPDGMSIDENDNLWVAHWGGSAVICWSPETGEMLEKIDVPAPHVTSCAFAGDDLKTLYITTARAGLSEQQLKQYPKSGGLFKVELDVKGVASHFYGK